MATPPPYGERRGQQQPPYVRLPRVYAHPEPPEPPRTNKFSAIVLTAVVLALIAAGVGAFVLDGEGPTGPPTETGAAPSDEEGGPVVDAPADPVDAVVGDCVMVNNADAADIAVTDCADPLAVYRVAVRRSSSAEPCPGESYVSYTLEGTLRLCLMLNARQGECFHETSEQDTRVDCAAEDASFQVARVFEGEADPNRCGRDDASNAIVYPEPKLTLCRVPLD